MAVLGEVSTGEARQRLVWQTWQDVAMMGAVRLGLVWQTWNGTASLGLERQG